MIAVDLDGTLLRTDKSISEYTKSILSQCREADIKVVYATGRGGSAEKVAPECLFDGRITMNGAVAYADNTLVYSRLIPYLIARPLLIACDQRGLKAASEISGMHYSNFITSELWTDINNYKLVDFSLHDIDAEKLYAHVENPEDAAFIESQLPEELYLTVSNDGLAQIMHRDATKSRAVAELARLWGITHSEVAAFGDDLNDIDMLSYAGIGVAMENALDEVKSAADFICPGNDDDGVATWISNNLMLKFDMTHIEHESLKDTLAVIVNKSTIKPK